MLTIHSLPELRRPVLVCAFSGWPDGAGSVSGAMGYLALKWNPQVFAEFDPDLLYAYSITRPLTGLGGTGQRMLHWPELAVSAVQLPHGERDLALLAGPEPDLMWKRCSQAIAELAKQIGAELLLTLGCFLAPVLHSAPVPLFARAPGVAFTRKLRQLGFQDTTYQGPTSFTTAVVDAAVHAGIAAASLWAAAPSYLRGVPNPKVSASLLEAVEKVAEVSLGLDELRAAGRDLEQRVDQALQQRPDLRRALQRMQEPEAEKRPAGSEEAVEPGDLPSPQAVLEDLENFLRQLQQQEGEQGGQ